MKKTKTVSKYAPRIYLYTYIHKFLHFWGRFTNFCFFWTLFWRNFDWPWREWAAGESFWSKIGDFRVSGGQNKAKFGQNGPQVSHFEVLDVKWSKIGDFRVSGGQNKAKFGQNGPQVSHFEVLDVKWSKIGDFRVSGGPNKAKIRPNRIFLLLCHLFTFFCLAIFDNPFCGSVLPFYYFEIEIGLLSVKGVW